MGFAFDCCTVEDISVHQPKGSLGAKRRLRREDCEFVKHDKLFSNWKILVGPSDWKDHAAGKEGVDRYHWHNLPANHFKPGVYELAVTAPSWLHTPHRQQSRTLRRQDVVVVYVGKADNIRQRLQHYGREGAHLEGCRSSKTRLLNGDLSHGNLIHKPRLQNGYGRDIDGCFAKSGGTEATRGPSLFSEVFALGSSIAFRWAETDSRGVALQVEVELLSVFDYAWNKGGNGDRRTRDILAKLYMGWPTPNKMFCTPILSGKTCVLFGTKRVGVIVAVRKPQDMHLTSERSNVGNFHLFFKNQPQVGGVVGTQCTDFSKFEHTEVKCGVLNEKGVPCSTIPVKGRKRCIVHKGMRVRGTSVSKPSLSLTSQDLVDTSNDSRSQESLKSTGNICLPSKFFGLFPLRSLKEVRAPVGWERHGKRPVSLSFNSWVKLESEKKTLVHSSCSHYSENEKVLAKIILQKTIQEKVDRLLNAPEQQRKQVYRTMRKLSSWQGAQARGA